MLLPFQRCRGLRAARSPRPAPAGAAADAPAAGHDPPAGHEGHQLCAADPAAENDVGTSPRSPRMEEWGAHAAVGVSTGTARPSRGGAPPASRGRVRPRKTTAPNLVGGGLAPLILRDPPRSTPIRRRCPRRGSRQKRLQFLALWPLPRGLLLPPVPRHLLRWLLTSSRRDVLTSPAFP